MNYYVDIIDASLFADLQNISMSFTSGYKSVSAVLDDQRIDENGLYIFSFTNIPPQCMGDSIKAELICGETVIASIDEYSVKQYLAAALKQNSDDEALVQLVTDMLAYGAAAQRYKEYNVDNPVSEGVEGTGTPSSSTPGKSDKSITTHVETIGNVYFKSATVRFDNVNKIGVKLSSTENARLFIDGVEVTLCDELFYYTTPIYANGFDKVYTFTLYEGEALVQTLTYSISSYVYSMQNSDNTEMKELANALYNYGVSAKLYEHVSKGSPHTTTNGICTICNENVGYDVDTANNTYSVYSAEALQSVLDKAAASTTTESTATVKLMQSLKIDSDTYYSLSISSGDVILDLNGYTLTCADETAILVAEGATLTVKDSGASVIPGAIYALSEGVKTTGIKNDGSLFVEGGTILANTFGILNNGTLTISGGDVGSTTHVAILGGEVILSGAPHLFNGSENDPDYLGCDFACSIIQVQTDLGGEYYTYYGSDVLHMTRNFAEFSGYSLSSDRTYFQKVN